MSFKSIFEKFQSNPKTKNNWLMPFRRSGVKVNLKSIRFDRVGGFSGRSGDIQSSARRTSALPNMQKVDSFLSNPVPISSVNTNSALFSKVHNTKKSKANIGLVLLVILILIVSSAGIYLYSTNKLKDKDVIVSECNSYLASQKNAGFTASESCNVTLSWFDYPFADSRASTRFENIKDSISKQISDQQSQLAQLDKDIRSTKQNLANIAPDFEKNLPMGSNPVPNTINDKQALLAALKTLLSEKDQLMNTTVAQFDYLVKIATDIDTQQEQILLRAFDGLSKNEKYKQYTALFDSYNKFKEKLITANPTPWFRKSLDNPDIFTYKTLFGDDFKNLFESTKLLNTSEPSNELVDITGNELADKQIVSIAEARGYKKRPLANENILVSLGSEKLQPAVKDAFEKLVAAAAQDGIRIGLVSGYRSIDEQKSLFLSRFTAESRNTNRGRAYTSDEIATGKADEALNTVLSSSSIPGYSRHHTGYAVDITDINARKDFTLFANTPAYQWISANNYFNAKRFGFIPSYPKNASNQGPEPESWEYVYVGIDAVK